jgi:peptidoglycan/LPS O-acetylase OafA/YrhL
MSADAGEAVDAKPHSKSRMASQESSRIAALDAVRGIAALLVVFHHCYMTAADLRDTGFAYVILGGRPSVIVFFVLSGYVLALSLDRGHDTVAGFVVRRFCRIYLPFAAAIAVAAWACWAFSANISVNSWFDDSWRVPVSGRLIARHLLMTGAFDDMQLDPVMWSLVYELRVSVLFPIIFWATRRAPSLTLLAAIGLHFAAAFAIFSIGLRNATAMTAYFVIFFVLGAALYLNHHYISGMLRQVPASVLAFAGLGFLTIHNDFALLLGSAVIVGAAAAGKFDSILRLAPALWLGRVSYSLYLIHFVVLLSLVNSFHGAIPLPFICVGTVAIALVASAGFYRVVERPAQHLGRIAATLVAGETDASSATKST